MELLEHVVRGAVGQLPRWNDQILGRWPPPERPLPAGQLPLGEDASEKRRHRHAPRALLLGALLQLVSRVVAAQHMQTRERLLGGIVIVAPQRARLADPLASQNTEGVDHAS